MAQGPETFVQVSFSSVLSRVMVGECIESRGGCGRVRGKRVRDVFESKRERKVRERESRRESRRGGGRGISGMVEWLGGRRVKGTALSERRRKEKQKKNESNEGKNKKADDPCCELSLMRQCSSLIAIDDDQLFVSFILL